MNRSNLNEEKIVIVGSHERERPAESVPQGDENRYLFQISSRCAGAQHMSGSDSLIDDEL